MIRWVQRRLKSLCATCRLVRGLPRLHSEHLLFDDDVALLRSSGQRHKGRGSFRGLLLLRVVVPRSIGIGTTGGRTGNRSDVGDDVDRAFGVEGGGESAAVVGKLLFATLDAADEKRKQAALGALQRTRGQEGRCSADGHEPGHLLPRCGACVGGECTRKAR